MDHRTSKEPQRPPIPPGCLPGSQKAAIITPVLKKSNLDQDDAKNYQPISNLTFISKVIERIVAEQIKKHLVDSNLMPSLQSAYRAGHSTETALIKVISDIIDAADDQQVTLLGLLDMSAAFDIVDHDILLHRLETSYGIRGRALRWLTSFLTGRTQAVSYAGSLYSIESATKSPYWLGTVFTAYRHTGSGLYSRHRPAYFGDVCAPVSDAPGRTNLRSATRGDLLIPRTRTKLGERSFRIAAPTVWNSLPYSLKHSTTSREHFRKELKTYLFRKAYAPASENY